MAFMNPIDFWALIERAHPGPGGHFGDTICRALEMASGLDPGSIAWVKSEWPGLECFIYEEEGNRDANLQAFKGAVNVTRATASDGDRLVGPGAGIDWIVRFTKEVKDA